MEFDEFVETNLQVWNEYLEQVFCLTSEGIWKLGTGSLSYPNIALFVETDDHYVFELFGATKDFKGLEKKTHRFPSTLKYLSQFDSGQEGPTFKLNGRDTGFINLLASRDSDIDAVERRFNINLKNRWPTKFDFVGGKGIVISFTEKFQSCFFQNCLLINRYDQIYRVKHILHMRIVSKDHPKEEYLADLVELLNKPWKSTHDLFGISYFIDMRDESSILAGQFANIFLLPELPETTIGKFLEKNPAHILGAFSCKNFLYEKEFEWIEVIYPFKF